MTSELVDSIMVFDKINSKYTKTGALIRGIRIREGLTQKGMAKKLNVTQSCVHQIEYGLLKVSVSLSKRIAKLFDVDYHSFLEGERNAPGI